MSDDLADLHWLDRALDDLASGDGADAVVEPRDHADAGAAPPGSQPDGAATVGGAPADHRDGAPTLDFGGAPTVELNGHRPARSAARRLREPAEDQQRSGAMEALAATAAELQAAVPAPPREIAARGRDAFLASADRFTDPQRRGRRRKLLLRASGLAAALLLFGIPGALARQALPGSPLYPVREVTQDARLALTPSPVSKARILLDDAERLRDEAVRSMSSNDPCIRIGQVEVEEALAKLRGVSGAAAERQWVRGQDLLDDFTDLAEGKLPGEDHSGPGGGVDHSGRGGGGDPGGDRHGGSGSSGSGSGGSTSGGSGDSGGGTHSATGSDDSGSTSGGSGSVSGDDVGGSGAND